MRDLRTGTPPISGAQFEIHPFCGKAYAISSAPIMHGPVSSSGWPHQVKATPLQLRLTLMFSALQSPLCMEHAGSVGSALKQVEAYLIVFTVKN